MRKLISLTAMACLFFSTANAEEVKPYDAPPLAGITSWINSEPLTISSLKGKVVLVDFWAYSCVNCVRTLPHLIEWDKKYKDKGLVIIGVHAPEFDFEKDADNVRKAVKKWGITYPVALDNDQGTWNSYQNRYWPAHYLIDKQGKVVYTHFGEGSYDVTENTIRQLLGLSPMQAVQKQSGAPAAGQTPETYLGYQRMMHFRSKELAVRDAEAAYHFPNELSANGWALSGKWTIGPEHITSGEPGGVLRLNFTSKKVFLVLGTASGKPVHATVTLGGKAVGGSAGKDAPDGKLTVEQHTLYELVAQPEQANNLLEITAEDEGFEAYAFTFGD